MRGLYGILIKRNSQKGRCCFIWSKYFTENEILRFCGGELRFPAVSSFAYSDNLPQWHYPWHIHLKGVELIFAAEGSGQLSLDNQTLRIEKGDIAIIPRGTGHMLTCRENETFAYYSMGITTSAGSTDMGSGMHPLSDDFVLPQGPLQDFFGAMPCTITNGLSSFTYFSESFRLLLSFYEMSGGAMTDAMKALIYSMLTLVKEIFTDKALTVTLDDGFSMADIIQYINKHSSEPITLQSIADHFHLSASHLSRLFNKAYHTSPINYLISVRLANACDLLLATRKSISEVASEVGYDNFSHFNVLFRKHMGCTPNAFRTQGRAESPRGLSGHSNLFLPREGEPGERSRA